MPTGGGALSHGPGSRGSLTKAAPGQGGRGREACPLAALGCRPPFLSDAVAAPLLEVVCNVPGSLALVVSVSLGWFCLGWDCSCSRGRATLAPGTRARPTPLEHPTTPPAQKDGTHTAPEIVKMENAPSFPFRGKRTTV